MKLIRFGAIGNEKPGILLDNQRYDVSAWLTDYNEEFFELGGISYLLKLLDQKELPMVPKEERWAACLARPSKLICVGLNYADHAAESNASIPKEPILFFKSTTAIVGPFDDLVIPKGGKKTDWEVELAVVVGKKGSYINPNKAMDYVAGYCLMNDYSERAFQLERNGQWTKGKGCDTFAPLGPFMVSKDEIMNVQDLNLWLKVNGRIMQQGNTKEMIFSVSQLVAYVSEFMTLLPGDIISTGTPAGVGMGQKPNPIYLRAGDYVELGIDGLGSSSQYVTKF
ncbi:MAG: FAA hydrolase family protein [Pedobacter sp.]|nr:MAG: FAA hydrolase family protein [Pedobacter sp.]